MDRIQAKLLEFYRRLLRHFGHRHWWPGDTPLEVMVGAILTQNTVWTNVEKAIANLKAAGALSAQRILALPDRRLATMLRPSGYFNIKTRRLKSYLRFYRKTYGANWRRMKRESLGSLRHALLGVSGVGPETADSILLYALGKPVFVVDAYTKRIFSRLGLLRADWDYHRVQDFFMRNLPSRSTLYNDYHAQIVQLGKDLCRKKNPKCPVCPVRPMCRYGRNVIASPRGVAISVAR